jgi:small subunit ribosomal protein S9
VPGAHLEPDLVLEEGAEQVDEYADRYAPTAEDGEAPVAEAEAEPEQAEAPGERPAPRSVVDIAADARYQATGKRKTSVARVILKPGDGAYTVNGRSLEDYFPRAALQKAARQPLQTAGFEKRMDVSAKIHGGGISAQAGALRHGVARALVEADPALRADLKRRGFLSRDARAKERKKAGLKKARKRPQFSKR